MAGQITQLKEELELTRNLISEQKKLFELKNDPNALSSAKASLSIERKILKSRIARNSISKEEADLQSKIISSQASILKRLQDGKTVTEASLKKLIESKQNLDAIYKSREKNKRIQEDEFNAIRGIAGKAGLGSVIGKVQELGNLWKVHPMLLVASVILEIFKQIFNVFKQIDEAAFKLRQDLGITRQYTKDLNTYARAAAVEFAHLGVNAEIAFSSISGLSKSLYGTMSVTPSMVKDMSLISASLGISADKSATFLKNLAMTAASTAEAQQSMVFFTTSMTQAAGVPLNEVMEDISSSAKNAYVFIKRSSLELIKAAVEAKRMGTSVGDTVKTSSSLLSFTSSVNAEMEASVLLGRSINLQRARELSYRRDLIGLNKEILRIAKETNFETLDPFQQEAIAKSLGKQAGEIGEMLQAERERIQIQRTIASSPALKKQQEALEKMKNATASISKDYGEIAKKQLMQESNQTRIKSITDSWNRIVMRVADKFLPAIDTVLKFVADNFDAIVGSTSVVVGTFRLWSTILKPVVNIVSILVTKFKSVLVPVSKFVSMGTKISSFGGKLTKLLPLLGKFGNIFKLLGTGGKAIPVLGEIIIALQGIWYGAKRLFSVFKDIFAGNLGKAFAKGLTLGPYLVWKILLEPIIRLFGKTGNKIADGIASAGDKILEAIAKPFQSAWNWLKKTFMGNSPSELGLMIVKGIASVQVMMFNFLVSPFKMAWDFIKKLPLISKIFGGNKTMDVSVDNKATIVSQAKGGTTIAGVKVGKYEVENDKSSDMLMKKLSDVVDAINGLRSDFASGKIMASVSIDAQKLDAATGRRLEFTGGLL